MSWYFYGSVKNIMTFIKSFIQKNKVIASLLLFWAILIAIGMVKLHSYSFTPGPSGNVPVIWPNPLQLNLDKKTPTLIMFAHPHCPCSKSSINELNRIMAQTNKLQKTYILFYKPLNFDRNWLESDLWHKAKAINGIQLLEDENGSIAKLFGAETSGHVLVYNEQGNLKFSGGITPGRSHEGDSSAKQALISYLQNKNNECTYTDTFGCTLFHNGGGIL